MKMPGLQFILFYLLLGIQGIQGQINVNMTNFLGGPGSERVDALSFLSGALGSGLGNLDPNGIQTQIGDLSSLGDVLGILNGNGGGASRENKESEGAPVDGVDPSPAENPGSNVAALQNLFNLLNGAGSLGGAGTDPEVPETPTIPDNLSIGDLVDLLNGNTDLNGPAPSPDFTPPPQPPEEEPTVQPKEDPEMPTEQPQVPPEESETPAPPPPNDNRTGREQCPGPMPTDETKPNCAWDEKSGFQLKFWPNMISLVSICETMTPSKDTCQVLCEINSRCQAVHFCPKCSDHNCRLLTEKAGGAMGLSLTKQYTFVNFMEKIC